MKFLQQFDKIIFPGICLLIRTSIHPSQTLNLFWSIFKKFSIDSQVKSQKIVYRNFSEILVRFLWVVSAEISPEVPKEIHTYLQEFLRVFNNIFTLKLMWGFHQIRRPRRISKRIFKDFSKKFFRINFQWFFFQDFFQKCLKRF